MRLISWNVNGIRSIYQKGFVEWITKESPDILCLQEIKADVEQFPSEITQLKSYKMHVSSADKKGYSGVATFSQEKILDTKKLEKNIFDQEGRTLIHEYEKFFLLNCYFPNGQRDHGRVPYKMEYCDEILKTIKKLDKKKPVIITGDFNTAHHPIDLANPKSNINTTGFLPLEREWMDKLQKAGFVDIYRDKYPEQTGAYTWWTYRGDCRERNIGWRIDYFLVSKNIINKVKKSKILTDVMGSDHAPIKLNITFKE
jgi:exodeoxyribonuclease-3